ncbi:MAG: glycoside hydrolase family 2 TIM barrel-domain containing protein [Limnochordia bacterium]
MAKIGMCILCLALLFTATVSLAAESVVRFDKLRFITGTDWLQITGVLGHQLSETITGKVMVSIADNAGQVVFTYELPQALSIHPQQEMPLNAVLTNLPVEAWWPERPTLYHVTLTFTAGSTRGEQTTRIGFRTFTAEDGHFYLNGLPYFLRGLQYTPMFSNGADEKLVTSLQNEPSFPTSLMRYLDEANINITKTPYQDLADELGIMNFGNGQGGYAMAPKYTSPVSSPSAIAQLRSILEQNVSVYHNHPSFVIPVFWNEAERDHQGIIAYHAQVRELMRELDPSRPVVANLGFGRGVNSDIDSAHWYWGYHTAGSELFRVRTAGSLAELQRKGKDDLPFVLTETGGNYTDQNGEFPYSRTGNFPTPDYIWIGRSHNVRADSLEYQAIVVKELIEGFRRARSPHNRIAGIIMFTAPFFFSDGKTITPKPAYNEVQTGMQPILVSTDSWKWHYYCGDTLKTNVHLVHDDVLQQILPAGEIRAALLSSTGEILTYTTLQAPELTYYTNWQAPIELVLPEVTAPVRAQLKLEYIVAGKVLSTNSEAIFLAPRTWAMADAELNVVPLAVYDPQGQTAAYLRDHGVAFTPLDDLSDPQLLRFPALIIGVNSLKGSEVTAVRDLLLAYAEQGGRVWVQKQAFNTGCLLPLSIQLSSLAGHSFMNVDRIDHSLFSGLKQSDFRFWADAEGDDLLTAAQGFRLRQVTDLRRLVVWGTMGAIQNEIVMAEYLHGSGSIFIDCSNTAVKAATDPFAGRLYANLANYIRNPKPTGIPTLTKPVQFGDFASEQGIIVAEELQGWKIQPNRKGRILTGNVTINMNGVKQAAGHLFFNLTDKPTALSFSFLYPSFTRATATILVNGQTVGQRRVDFGQTTVTVDVSELNINPQAIQVTLALSHTNVVVTGFTAHIN